MRSPLFIPLTHKMRGMLPPETPGYPFLADGDESRGFVVSDNVLVFCGPFEYGGHLSIVADNKFVSFWTGSKEQLLDIVSSMEAHV